MLRLAGFYRGESTQAAVTDMKKFIEETVKPNHGSVVEYRTNDPKYLWLVWEDSPEATE